MIKFEKQMTYGWEEAIRGMRNPMNSWDKSDTGVESDCFVCVHKADICDVDSCPIAIGPNDYELIMKLRKAGTDHRKFMRMIAVYVDITAPLYWWKEFDTYKVGTVSNSCSTMHKIHAQTFTYDDFSTDKMLPQSFEILLSIIDALNIYRDSYNKTKDKVYWDQMIQLLPCSYNQKRTIMLNYEVLANIYRSRQNHKLEEWRKFCEWIETLPYSEIITCK